MSSPNSNSFQELDDLKKRVEVLEKKVGFEKNAISSDGKVGDRQDGDRQGGGVPSKVMIAGKSYTIYVKVNGEFMTISQADKVLKAKNKK